MASTGSLLVTGAAGMVGREITRVLLTKTDRHLTLLLHNQGRRLSRRRLLQEVFDLKPVQPLLDRLRLVRGDIREPRLGLSVRESTELTQHVDRILHAAASTRFDLPLAAARRVNVAGTRNVVRFAQACPNLNRLGLLSTVFVSGRRRGRILESEREHREGFVNTYEQSKYEAEACLESSQLPYTIYRLSTLIGDSGTGATSHFTAPHQSLRIMHLGLSSLVPGFPDCSVDLVPTDWAAATVVRLFLDRFHAGQVVHLVAGRAKSYSLAEIIDESYRILGQIDPRWAARRYPKPAIASREAFRLLVRSAGESNDTVMLAVLGTLQHFSEQFLYPKEFDTANLDGALAPPDVRHYYTRVVAFCLRTRWGRRA